ncbi:MAG: cytochrome c [Bacteroidota bacterium]
MKKIYLTLLVAGAVMVFTYCKSTKNATASAATTETKPVVKKVSYQDNVMAIIQTNCTPCHFPDKGGNKKPLNSYTAVSANSDEILRRIQLMPTERGFMPNRKAKLPDSTINVIKQWKADGLTEK